MSKEKRYLLESATLIGESANSDGTWKVRIISEGQGSSGFYSRELLENYYHAFSDVLSYKNHPDMFEGPETRDFTMIVGEIVGEAWIEDDERGMAAVYGNYLADPEYRDKLDRYKNKLGVSIYISGEGEFDQDTGNFNVVSFDADDPYRSLDVVLAAGARGKFLESMKKTYARMSAKEASTASVEDTPDTEGLSPMAEKDVLEAISKLTVAVEAMTESKHQEAKAEADNAAAMVDASKQVEAFAAALEAISQAGLLPTQVESLKTRAKAGEDITAAIEEAKAIAVEARTAVQESLDTHDESGRFTEGAGTTYTLRSVGGSK